MLGIVNNNTTMLHCKNST